MPEETTPSKKISWLKVILIGVTTALVVVLIGEGLFWYFYVREPTESTSVTTTKQTTPSAKKATPSAEKDETADWELVKNQQIGVSIKHSSDWGLTRCSGKNTIQLMTIEKLSSRPKELHCQSDFLPTIVIGRHKSYSSAELVDIWDDNNDSGWFSDYRKEAIVIDQKAGTKVSYTASNKAFEQPEGMKMVYYIFDIKGGETVQILYRQFPEDPDHIDTFNKILETLKFLD